MMTFVPAAAAGFSVLRNGAGALPVRLKLGEDGPVRLKLGEDGLPDEVGRRSTSRFHEPEMGCRETRGALRGGVDSSVPDCPLVPLLRLLEMGGNVVALGDVLPGSSHESSA